MFKLVVLNAVFAVVLARPGYHGVDHVSIAVPRFDVHSQPIVAYNVPHHHHGDLQAVTLNSDDFHHGIHHGVQGIDHLQSITIDASDLQQDNIHEIADHYVDAHNNIRIATPIVEEHQVPSHFEDDVHVALNTHYVSSPTVHSENIHQVHSAEHISAPIHSVELIHGSAPVYSALNTHYVSSPVVHSEDVHSVEAVQVSAPVVSASNVHYVQAAPSVVSHSSQETISSHEVHQVHGAPAVHHAVPVVHLGHQGHHVVQAVHSAPAAVSHSSRVDVVKSSSSVVATPSVAHHGYAGPAIHAW